MKLLTCTFFILFAIVFSELGVAFYDLGGEEISLIDSSSEGDSERDAKDASEDDTEVDFFNYSYDLDLINDLSFVCHSNETLKSYFLEIPSPPPDYRG